MPTPDYVLEIRKKIGHDPLWLPGVTAVVLDDAHRVLLVKRTDNGAWTPISGIVDPGEEPAVAAEREALEETCVTVVTERLASIGAEATPHAYPNGDQVHFVDLTFRCRYVSGDARVGDDESTEVAWFDLGRLPQMHQKYLDRIGVAASSEHEARFSRG